MAKSMALNQAAGLQGMLKDGHKTFDGVQGAVLKNIEAARAIAGMMQTSMGPNGMNKLVINHLEKIIVSSDCATILKELEIQHPAAKLLELASESQEQEFGDNSNFVISFAGELLKNAEDLIRDGLHTAEIVTGYQRAFEKVLEMLPSLVVKTVQDVRNRDQMIEAIKSTIATKQYGYEDLFSGLVVDAAITTFPANKLKPRLNMDSVRIAKLRGGSIPQSTMLKGVVILRPAEGIVKKVTDAKVCVFGSGIEASQAEAKSTVLLKNADELLNYNKSEERSLEALIKSVADSGVKMVVSHGSISEMAMHFLDKFGLMVIKIQSKFELRRVCLALGATALVRLGAPTPEEMGECSLIEVREVAGRKITVFEQNNTEDTSIATVVCRAATEHVLNDVERAIDDGIFAFKTLCEEPRLLPGAGAIELELNKRLKAHAETVTGLDQYAINKFADSFDVIPRQLAENSGNDPTKMMHTLHQSHVASDGQNMGFDIEENCARDSVKFGVFDLYGTKVNALRLAVETAITILRVDQIVMSKPAGGPAPGGPPGGGGAGMM